MKRHERLCPFCKNNEESEIHFVIQCPIYANLHKQYLTLIPSDNPMNDWDKCITVLESNEINSIARFLYEAFKCREYHLEVVQVIDELINNIKQFS